MTREDIKNKTLHLVLKGKWYDMIDRGEKKEEYREVKQYWMKRLIEDVAEDEEGYTCCHVFYVDYDCVCFHRGYTSTTMTFAVESIETGQGKPEWGAPTDIPVFIIKLGERL